jgi:hypothetical protein
MIDIDVIRTQAPQARFACLHQMIARRSQIVGTFVHAERGLGRDQHLVAPFRDRFPQDGLGKAQRIDVRRIEQVHARVETDVDHSRSFGDIARSPGLEKLRSTTERSRSKTQDRNLQS